MAVNTYDALSSQSDLDLCHPRSSYGKVQAPNLPLTEFPY